jgi:hypothetical protein
MWNRLDEPIVTAWRKDPIATLPEMSPDLRRAVQISVVDRVENVAVRYDRRRPAAQRPSEQGNGRAITES